MTDTHDTTSKNIWKKPLAVLLGFSILAGMSNTCFANEQHEQGASEQQPDSLNSQNHKTETEESSDEKSVVENPANICKRMIKDLQSSHYHEKLGLTKEEAGVIKKVSARMQKRLDEYLIINDTQNLGGYDSIVLYSKLLREQRDNLSEEDKKYFESFEKKEDIYHRSLFFLN